MSSNLDKTTDQQAVVSSETGWDRELWFDDDLSKHPVVRELRAAFPDDFLDAVRFRNETTVYVTPARFRDIAMYMRDHEKLQLNFLSDLTAVDMLTLRTSPRFDVTAQLYSIPNRTRLRLKASINDGETIPSLVPVFNGANFLERECYDMFGIFFEGHPNLRRILLQDDWDEGYPLRKDYPTRGWKDYPIYNKERTIRRTKTRWTGRGV